MIARFPAPASDPSSPPHDIPMTCLLAATAYRHVRWGMAVGYCVLGMLACASPTFAQAANWPTERAPRPLPAREVKFPPYEIRTISNGMQVVTVLHHEQPAVTMRLLVRAGAAQDPERKHGVASLTASLLDQGTSTRSAQQIADQIDSIGGAMGTGSGADLTFVNAVVMKDSFIVAMDLLADVVRNPAFAPEEIERQKEQSISSQRVSTNDPDYVASVLLDRLVYGFHPYGLPGSGTPETLPGITRQDLQAFHRTHFVPNNMVLAIVGDVTSEEAFSAAERVFGQWPRGEVPLWKSIEPPPPTRRVIIVDKPDSVQTEIRVGQLAIRRKHADYLAWDLAVKILGGEGANRLHRVLRSERGLTYGASADTQAMKQAGDFVAETDTRTETTGEALRLMVDEFSRLPRQRVSERELADAQAYLSGSFPLTIETPNEIATQVINTVFYELPVQEISTFRERVLAITPDDIQRVAREYVRPDRLSIVLVGNAQGFVEQLRAIGFTEFEIIPIGQLDLMSATLKREARRAGGTFGSFGTFGSLARASYTDTQVNPGAGAVRPNAPNDSSALDLLRRVVEAKGGLGALKGVRTVVAEAETTFLMQQGQLPSATKTYIAYPDRFRVDADVAGAQVIQIYNAGNAWVKDPAGVHDAPPPMRADFAANVRRDIIPLLIGASEGRLSVRSLPDERGRAGSGVKSVKVLELSGGDIQPVRLYIDDQMLIAGQSFSAPGPGTRPVLTEEVFADYRLVNGVRVPFEAQLLQNGRPVLKRTLKTVDLNAPIADTLFARPL
jgi:zinc protease